MYGKACPLHCSNCEVAKILESIIPFPEGVADCHIDGVVKIRRRVCEELDAKNLSERSVTNFLEGQRMASCTAD
jgi:hypothetical protein